MTSFSQYAAMPRSRRGRRSCAIALVAAGVVLLPAGTALAEDMPGMNGTMCPHASGEGPDALAAAGPNEPAAPERAPNSGPIAPVGAPAASSPAQKPSAPKPVAQAPRPVTQVTQPATQVTQPATHVGTQRPVTTTARSSPVVAKRSVRAVAATTVAEPSRGARARAKHPARHLRPQQRSSAQRVNGLEPRSAGPYVAPGEPIAVTVSRPATADRPSGLPTGLLLGLIALAAAMAGLLVRRRGAGGIAAVERPDAPIAPAYADTAIEAELHEIISEARARQLLAPRRADEDAERGESVGTG